MTFFLITVFLVLIGLIVYLQYKMFSERNAFASKLEPLEQLMIQLNEDCKNQSLQIQLSEDLKVKMKEVNAALSRNIFDLNYQLFEDSYPKNER
ncbi:MAG: hypothetical protein C0525_07605 [Flavobacterium sp.]|uniref:hypothetical protein n=1 Tax=Flavobacterium sp. TaxID=239 RepID=UPI0025C620D9|nr:hypothetical protein [Flavobacterium sp.]MBA4134574.1 hypothetical protein [Flavobacterium sp.]